MRVSLPYRLRMPALLMMSVMAVSAAQEQTMDPARVTVVVRADQPLRAGAWTALTDALARSLEGADGRPGERIELMRAEDVRPGLEVDRMVLVMLHGDCTLWPGPRVNVSGALGWVPRRHGRIEPFIHVECGRIVQMLAPRALALRPAERETVMAAAVARVVEHEWVHIATQSAAHSEHGVMQGQFTVLDLLEDAERAQNR
ncbi:MAG TPA: hypothetical protein VN151_03890 [Terracidiphilus sp.]|nr:hypothetical protein [Terracidiphilus sp.]